MVLAGITDENLVAALCERHDISQSEFYAWRDTSLRGAAEALAAESRPAAPVAAR